MIIDMKIKLLNYGGYGDMSNVDFPVEVEATQEGSGAKVHTSQLYMVGADAGEFGNDRSWFFSDHEFEIIDNEKPFDITQHEWSDVIAEIEPESGETLVIKSHGTWISYDKDDIIAMAKDRGVKPSDLK